jgi:hypothetical protein
VGHYCKICDRTRANEAFSGKGHKNRICKKCTSQGKNVLREKIAIYEIKLFWGQSNISKYNISKLKILANSESKKVAKLASLVLEVALIAPQRKKRLKVLAEHNQNLLKRLKDTSLMHGEYSPLCFFTILN